MARMPSSDKPNLSRTLRERAEALLEAAPVELPSMPAEDLKAVVYELNVHQMELEIQNEELRQAQVELAESRDRYADLYEFAPVGYVTLGPDGRILEANLTAATMLGVEREALPGANLSGFVRRESQDELYLHRQAVFSGDDKQRCRLEMKKTDGTRSCVRLESIAFGPDDERRCRTALVDNTDYTQVEEAQRNLTATLEQRVAERTGELRDERNFIDAVLENQPALVLVMDRDARAVRFNKAFETATGHAFEALRGGTAWMDLIPADEREAFQEQVVSKLQSGQRPVRHEIHFYHRGGSKHLFSCTGTVLKDADDAVRFLICIGVDITDQRKAEGEARRHLDEAARLQRLQTASELATVLAHELNQPLGAISVFADASRQLLEHASLDRDKLADNLRRIGDEGLRGGEIIRRLRNFIKMGEVESVPLELNAVVQHACVLIEPKAKDSDVRLNLDLCETLLPVKGVEVHLAQVLLNLLGNAIEAIHDAGMAGELVTIETRQRDKMARVTVRDNGPGIDAEAAAQIFEFLHSTKDYGLGVGLRISRSLIEAHGGRLWVEPHATGGIVHFEVPLAP